ncbi:ECF transporter S component [Alkalibacter saccharofermentans]|uniref:Uncharacterized membrane protein n=1 Tax=Alkalibacter saccharofermentans DSM 14828 TaxID=1120975 RepID=A0A1M4ZSQ1_9FIRM|nr:ECF transporter S component [Alkalibacter saccharofermentans]SHF21038.1 Uncharacterized membrane protein [Alkalibacter saccharofermentans DSM 14828]
MKDQTTINSFNSIKTRDLVETGLLIAMVFVSTMFINIRLPISINGGLIHLGNVALFLSAMLFGKNKGAIAGAFGMGLFDILSGWAIWAPFTFVVRGIMGYIIGSISHSKNNSADSLYLNILAIIAGGIWMVAGYYLTEVILYGNLISPITSIPGNITQLVFGSVALFILPALKKIVNAHSA